MPYENINAEQERQIFKRLSLDEQMEAIYEILAYMKENQQGIASRQAVADKHIIDIQGDLKRVEKDNKKYRDKREEREKKVVELLETSPDIAKLPPEEKQKMTDKFWAIVNKRDETWLPILRDLIRLALALVAVITAGKILP